VQVQQRQHLVHLQRLTRPRGQNRRGEPFAADGIGVDTAVVDPRRGHRHRTRSSQHIPLAVVAVADHQPPPVLVEPGSASASMSGGDFGLQRRRNICLDHRERSHPATIRPTRRSVVGVRVVMNYFEHGRTFPNQRENADS